MYTRRDLVFAMLALAVRLHEILKAAGAAS